VKLSAHGKQRLFLGLAILIGGAAILYAYINLLILPLRQTRIEGMNILAENQDKIDKAKNVLQTLASVKADVGRLQEDLAVATNQFIIRPVLGSTLVTVQNAIEPIAQKCGLQVDSCVERGRMEIPGTYTAAGFVVQRYLVELTAVGAYATVRDFVQTLEQSNACVCVTDLDVTGRAEDVVKHKVRICMEWPVFSERKAEVHP